MSDFLNNLIARSIGALPTIQPRLPSLYESYRRGGSLGAPFETGEGATDAGLVVGPASSKLRGGRTAPSRTTSPHEDADQQDVPSSPSVSFLPWKGAWSESRPTIQPPADQPSARDANPAVLPATTSGMARGTPDESTPRDASEDRSEGIRPVVLTDFFDRNSLRNQGTETKWTSDVPAQSTSHPDERDRDRAIPGRSMPAQPNRVAGPLRIAGELLARRQSDQPRSSPNEPPIHVTIGRVEVRAVFPAPPSRRTSSARSRPTLSLDDYLKQRDRGQR